MGGPRLHLGVTYDPIDLGALLEAVADPRSGAVATFLGTVRSPDRGREVRWIDYEGYEAMIAAELDRVADAMMERHGLLGLAIVHRLGRCLPGDASIAIVACSPHREAAFDACRELLKTCKARLPVWKHQVDEAEAYWVDGTSLEPAQL